MSDDVERAAEAMWQAESRRAGGRDRLIPWSDESEQTRDMWRGLARAALTASRSSNDEIVEVLEEVLAIPAVRSVLGTRHTSDCNCPCCRARALLSKVKEQG